MQPTDVQAQAPETEKRRLPRVNLSHEQFRLAANGKLFWVSDISASGFAVRILDSEQLIHFSLGKQVEGELNLHGDKQRVRAQVQHLGRSMAGLQFQDLEAGAQEAIRQFLDPKHLAEGLKRMPTAHEEGSSWWSGSSGTELMVWQETAEGTFERALLLLWGKYVEWESTGRVSTGRWSHAHEEPEMRGAIRLESLFFRPDAKPDSAQLSVAKAFLTGSKLPQPLVKGLLAGI